MQISPIQQNNQVNFKSIVYIKNCSKIFDSKKVQQQISKLRKNGNSDIILLRGYEANPNDGTGCINMNIINNKTCEARTKDFFFEKGQIRLGSFYKKLLKEQPTETWKY